MKTIDDVPLILRREIEALIVAPLIDAFAKEIGKERSLEILQEVILQLALEAGRKFAGRVEENDLPSFVEHLLPLFEAEALELKIKKVSEDETSWDTTRCCYAEMYKKHGLEELGYIMSCSRDGYLFEGYNEELRFIRDYTIMEGDDYCDFTIVKKESK